MEELRASREGLGASGRAQGEIEKKRKKITDYFPICGRSIGHRPSKGALPKKREIWGIWSGA